MAAGQVKAGYVISTRGRWLAERRWPGKLRFQAGDPADRFPICAAVRKSDGDLRAAIDQALDELARSGRLAAVFARWQVYQFDYRFAGFQERFKPDESSVDLPLLHHVGIEGDVAYPPIQRDRLPVG